MICDDDDLFNSEEEKEIAKKVKSPKGRLEPLQYAYSNDPAELAKAAERMLSDLVLHIQSTNFHAIFEMETMIKQLPNRMPQLAELINGSSKFVDLWKTVATIKEAFKDTVKESDIVDYFHSKTNKWYQAKILQRTENIIKVHYMSWGSKFDEELNMDTSDILPLNTFTKVIKKAIKKRNINQITNNQNENSTDDFNPHEIKNEISPFDTTIIKSNNTEQTTKSGRRSIMRTVPPVVLKEKKEKKTTKQNDNSDWICSSCLQLERTDGSDLIICDGPCR
eukprot:gene11621-24326_t